MESRRDYRKMMNIKKRNKNYAKATILGAMGLGFFGITTQVNAEEWKANSVEQIKEAVKEVKDGIYIIKSGDTLSGISEATGITIETLAKVNNIRNVDLIYAGDKLIIKTEDGKVALVDENNQVKNEVNLSKEDKVGIKEVQKQDNSNVYTNNGSSSNTNKVNNNNIINTVKPVKPSEGNGGGNTGGTTNPVNPTKPVDSIKPIDPTKPLEKEYVITINHVSENGEVLSKETRKAKEGTIVEAEAIDFSDRNYELIGDSTQTVNVKEDTTITFKYKKIDDTKPEVVKVDVSIKHLGDDGKVLSTETIKAEKDSIVKADAKDFTEQGYVLNDEISKEVKASEGATITFNYRKIEDVKPVDPTNEDRFVVVNVDTEGNDLGQNVDLTKYELQSSKKDNGIVETLENGNTITTYTTTNIYKLKEDEKPYEPKHTEETVIVNVDEEGYILKDTTGYTKVSESTDSGAVYTSENGDTHTVYTKTVVWKQTGHVPQHKNVYRTVNVDTEGNSIDNTNLYDYVSESTDNGITTTFENGDTETVYTTTKVWKKKSNPNLDYGARPTSNSELFIGEYHVGNNHFIYYDGVGNSGMTFASQQDADNWAFENNPNLNGNYGTWEVLMNDTKQVRITVEFF